MIILLSQDKLTCVETTYLTIRPAGCLCASILPYSAQLHSSEEISDSTPWEVVAFVPTNSTINQQMIPIGLYNNKEDAKSVLDTALRFLDNGHRGYCLPPASNVPDNKQYTL